jgi:hypothetical protein
MVTLIALLFNVLVFNQSDGINNTNSGFDKQSKIESSSPGVTWDWTEVN